MPAGMMCLLVLHCLLVIVPGAWWWLHVACRQVMATWGVGVRAHVLLLLLLLLLLVVVIVWLLLLLLLLVHAVLHARVHHVLSIVIVVLHVTL